MALKIIRPGMFTTVQDCGRWGFQSRGVPVSGAMDLFSHRLANMLVGNTRDEATLEVTLIGPEVEFESDSVVAVTGAEFRLALDDGFVQMNQAFNVRAGSRLKFGDRSKGARAYVAVVGGIDVPSVLGSRSTFVLTKMSGFEGRALRAGDVLATSSTRSEVKTHNAAGKWVADSSHITSVPSGGAMLRVIPAASGAGQLTSQRYSVSSQSNRMGYRLDGPVVFATPAGGMISAPVPTGAIQVPPSGKPILLMADHATSGGYAVVATVITADLPLAGQLAPGDWVEFRSCTLEDADAALRAREAVLARHERH